MALVDDQAVLPPLLYPLLLSSERLLRYSDDTGPNDGDLRGVELVYVLRDEAEGGGCDDCADEFGYLGGLYGDGDGPLDEPVGLDEDEEVERLYIGGREGLERRGTVGQTQGQSDQVGRVQFVGVLSTRLKRVMVVRHTRGAHNQRGREGRVAAIGYCWARPSETALRGRR